MPSHYDEPNPVGDAKLLLCVLFVLCVLCNC